MLWNCQELFVAVFECTHPLVILNNFNCSRQRYNSLLIDMYIYIKKLLYLYLEQFKLFSIAKRWALSKLLQEALDSFIAPSTDVAMVVDIFQKNWIMMPRKLSKIVGIFFRIEYIKTRGSYFGQKWSDQYFPCKSFSKIIAAQLGGKYWSNSFWPEYDPLVLMYSISANILTIFR